MLYITTLYTTDISGLHNNYNDHDNLVCHYIASTKLRLFSKKGSDDEQDVNQDMSNVTNYIIDSKQGQKTDQLMRRPTIANLKDYHNKTKGQGEHINLEKQFLEKFSNMGQLLRFP